MLKRKVVIYFLIGLLVFPSLWWGGAVSAQSVSQSELEKLQKDIEDRGSRLKEIEKEIARFEGELKVVGAEKQTLQKAINQLSLERKKIEAEITKTETLITSTDLEISKLVLEISKTEDGIAQNKTAVMEIIQDQNVKEEMTMVELLLQKSKFSEFLDTLESHKVVQANLANKVDELLSLKNLLNEKKDTNTQKRSNLTSLQSQYQNQNKVLVNNQAEQGNLLEVTKNEEKNYQRLLAEQKSARDQIEKELRNFESQIKFLLDTSKIPTAGSSVFAWPLQNFVITQLFGGTEFAKNNPGIYGRAYHPGIDLGAPTGTPILAPLAGTVRATGNTDAVPGCYSWGKWTLIDHANGLSTLYAHQNVIGVEAGQKVNTGDIIGYVGSTGFATGPHLHFTVYAKDGVSVRKFNEIKTVTGCGPATTPVASSDAYLDPMSYLPAR